MTYISRKYELNSEDIYKLLLNHSKTEFNERKVGVGEQGQPHHLINDLNFLHPTNSIISQNIAKITQVSKEAVQKRVKELVSQKKLVKSQKLER